MEAKKVNWKPGIHGPVHVSALWTARYHAFWRKEGTLCFILETLLVYVLECALFYLIDFNSSEEVPAVTALNFNGNLTYGVGMSTGQVLLYDIRMNKPYRIKDHMYELPIRDVQFLGDYVLSMDSSIVKIWNKEAVSSFSVFYLLN